MQILDSRLAPRFTLLRIIQSTTYLNVTSFSCNIGGDKGSVSGNFSTTSTSFSTGFNSGLQEN